MSSRLGTDEKKVTRGKTEVCMMNAPSMRSAYMDILFIIFLYFNDSVCASVYDLRSLLTVICDAKL